MPIITKEFQLKMPDNWWIDPDASVENSSSTVTDTYRGDDKCYLAIAPDGTAPYGFGAVSEKEMNEGPPEQGDDHTWLEIDCSENPVFCSVHGDLDPQILVDGLPEADMQAIPITEGYEGYPPVVVNMRYEATDFYRQSQIDIVDGEPFLIPYTTLTHMFGSGARGGIDWDRIKKERNEFLSESDKYLADDMPEAMKTEILTYRQLLRDMPATLKDVPPHLAFDMMPPKPAYQIVEQGGGEDSGFDDSRINPADSDPYANNVVYEDDVV